MKMDDSQNRSSTLNMLLPAHLIERVEIIKGPAARIYGQNAFNGAINIVTKSAWKSDKKEAVLFLNNISGGSMETLNIHFTQIFQVITEV